MCLRDQGIDNDNNDGGIGGGIQDRGISDNNGGVRRGRVIDNTSNGSKKTAEAAGD